MSRAYRTLPEIEGINSYNDVRTILNNTIQGKLNCVGDFTILPNTMETKVDDRNAGDNSFIWAIGLDKNSTTSSFFLKNRDVRNRSFILGHDLSEFERKYTYIVIG